MGNYEGKRGAAGEGSVGPRELAGDGEDFGVDEAVGGDGFAGVDGGGALPIGELAAGFFDDRLDGGGVPNVHDGIDHELGAAGGDEQIAVTGAPSAGDVGGFLEGFVGGGCAALGEGIDLGSEEEAVGERLF